MYEDEEALIAASCKAYQTASQLAGFSNTSSAPFNDGSDLIVLDEPDPSSTPAPNTVHSETGHSAKRLGKRRESNMLIHNTSLDALEQFGGFSAPRKLTKREIREVCLWTTVLTSYLQLRAKDAGPKWFGMPGFPGSASYDKNTDARVEGGRSSFTGGDARAATEKEMRRQVTAIRLRNALDPKRFYRGSGGTGSDGSMPAYAQLGRIVGGGLEPSSMLTRKQRSDSVVGELIRDSASVSYSKRKFGEVCLIRRLFT